MHICPVDREWIHNYLLEPYLQGAALWNLAWKGVDQSIAPHPIPLRERLIYWLQGLCLMIPCINMIIWLAWQTFGTPEKLFDPYCPEIKPPPAEPAVVPKETQSAPLIQPIVVPEQKTMERFAYNEATSKTQYQTNWEIQYFSDKIEVQQNRKPFFTSTATYHPDWSPQEYRYQVDAKEVSIAQDKGEGSPIHLTITETGADPIERTFELEKPLPWIQQRGVGFKLFLQSSKKILHFYAVVPEIPAIVGWIQKAPFLIEMVATKMGTEEVPGHGSLLKMEVVSAWKWPYNAVKSELWFDDTGCLKQFVDSGSFIDTKTGQFVPHNPLPV